MAELLVLEFSGVGVADYNAVNEKLGIDMATGAGEWPAGLQRHIGGAGDDGTIVITEVWESREAQGAFMQSRLADALAAGGVTTQPRVTWATIVSDNAPGG